MNSRTRRVLIGLMNLTREERLELAQEIEKYDSASTYEKRTLRESHERIQKMDVGPVGSGCPCCGR